MRKHTISAGFVSLALAAALVGCDDKIAEKKSTDVKSDGTVVEKKETVTEKSDGTVEHKTEKDVSKPDTEVKSTTTDGKTEVKVEKK
jgi:hypothetical protein